MSDSLACLSSGPANPKDVDHYRKYFIPACNLSEEQQLLGHYAQERFANALRGIYADFYLLIELMRGHAGNNDHEDFTCFLPAEKWQQPLDRLSKACSASGDWKLIRQKTVGVDA